MVEQILADSITCPIYIGEFEFPKYRIFRQDGLPLTFPPKHIHSFLNEVEVIAEDCVIGDDRQISFCHHNA